MCNAPCTHSRCVRTRPWADAATRSDVWPGQDRGRAPYGLAEPDLLHEPDQVVE